MKFKSIRNLRLSVIRKLLKQEYQLKEIADLRGSNLSGSNLSGSNLSGSNLSWSNLSGSNLSGSNLSGSNLSGSDLSGSDLRGSNLSGSDLRWSNGLYLSCPEFGDFIGWKKCQDKIIVKLKIPENAKRSSATGRKCRAEFVEVLEIIGAEIGISQHDNKTKYKVGDIVKCDKWEENRFIECGGGIHFFITKAEAENY